MYPSIFRAPALALALPLLFVGCDRQEPSFTSQTERTDQRSANGTVSASADATAADKAAPTGEDSTKGDKEPNDEHRVVGSNGTSGASTEQSAEDANASGTHTGAEDFDVSLKPGTEGAIDFPPGTEGAVVLPKIQSRELTFAAQTVGQGSISKGLDAAYLTSGLTLTRSYMGRTKTMTQLSRATAVDSFEQGNYGARESQAFNQIEDRPLDIIVVIDDSGSMAEEQQNMASKLTPLLSYVQDADWQIGVVTTDPDEGCLRKLIKKGDANAAQLFSQAVTAGVAGSGNERGVLQAVRAMAGTCIPQPWLRTDSTVAVLIVSDEDNCSANGGDCPGKDYGSSNYLYDYLASIREPGKNARVYGLFWHPTQTQAQCSTAANKAVQYSDLVTRTSGTWGSICAADYSATLAQMSLDIKTVLNTKFTLTYAPDPLTVHVFVDSVERTTGLTITGKVVELTPPPAAGAVIRVDYRHDPMPLRSSFVLRYIPDPSLLTVTVEGQTLGAGDYQVDPGTMTVRLAATPSEYSHVVVNYTRNDVVLTQTFQMGESIKAGSLTANVNGATTNSFSVVNTTGAVTLSPAPADGARLDFAYQAVGAPLLRYPFAPAYAMPVDLEAFDTTTGDPVTLTYALGFVSIAAADFVEGRRLTLRYDNVQRQHFDLTLPVDPLAGVSATGGQVTCTDATHLVVSQRMVAIDGCGFADDVATVNVNYSYVLEDRKEFTFTAPDLPAANEFQKWSVWVDGQVRTDYLRQANKISFASALPFGAMVRIELQQELK